MPRVGWDTFEGGLDEAQVELAALVAVAHALPQAVPLQDALLEAHHVGVLPPEARQGPEFRQRQLHVLGGVATDPFHRQPGAATARHRFVHHAVGPAADFGQQAVPWRTATTTTTTTTRAGPRRYRRRLRRHRAPPRCRPPPPRCPLCPTAAAVRRFHGAAAGGGGGRAPAAVATAAAAPPAERRAGEGARAAASEGGKARPACPFKRSANRGAAGRTTVAGGGWEGGGEGGSHTGIPTSPQRRDAVVRFPYATSGNREA